MSSRALSVQVAQDVTIPPNCETWIDCTMESAQHGIDYLLEPSGSTDDLVRVMCGLVKPLTSIPDWRIPR